MGGGWICDKKWLGWVWFFSISLELEELRRGEKIFWFGGIVTCAGIRKRC